MRKAIEAFEKEFAQWGLTLPARDVVDRQAGHAERHGWTLDYSFGSDAFGEYLEYHARRAVASEPVIERHARVYANGERNFVPAPAGVASDEPVFIQPDPAPKRATTGSTKRPTMPPFQSLVEEAAGKSGRPSASTKRVAPRSPPTPRPAPRREPPSMSRRATRFGSREKVTVASFAIGVAVAVLVAIGVVTGVKAIRGHRAATIAAADSASLDPVLVYAPAVLGYTVEGTSPFTQPLVGRPLDPNRAEVIRPERGMTPIIPSDPGTKRPNRPAATTRNEKFHVP